MQNVRYDVSRFPGKLADHASATSGILCAEITGNRYLSPRRRRYLLSHDIYTSNEAIGIRESLPSCIVYFEGDRAAERAIRKSARCPLRSAGAADTVFGNCSISSGLFDGHVLIID